MNCHGLMVYTVQSLGHHRLLVRLSFIFMSDEIGECKRTTGGAGIANDGVSFLGFRLCHELCWVYSGNHGLSVSFPASLSTSHPGYGP